MSVTKHWAKGYLSFGALFACLLLLFTACGSTSTTTGSGTSNTTTANCPHPISLSQLTFGVIPAESQTSVIGETQPFADALSKQICKPVKIFVGTSYTAVITAMTNQKADMAVFGPLSYVLAAQKGGAQAISLELSTTNKETTYQSYMITTPKTGIKTIKDLKGKTFSFVDPASTSGYLEPSYMMVQAGLDPTKDVKGSFLGSHDASLLAVLSGKAQAGAVASDTYNELLASGKFKQGDLDIIAKSSPIPEGPVAVRKGISQSDMTSLQNALLALNNDPAALKALDAGGFQNTTDSTYDGIRDLVKTLNLDLGKLVS